MSQIKSHWMNQYLLSLAVSLVFLVCCFGPSIYWLPHPIISPLPLRREIPDFTFNRFQTHSPALVTDSVQNCVIVCVFPSRALIHLPADGCNWSQTAVSLCYWIWQLYTSAPVPSREMLKCEIFLTVRKETRHIKWDDGFQPFQSLTTWHFDSKSFQKYIWKNIYW